MTPFCLNTIHTYKTMKNSIFIQAVISTLSRAILQTFFVSNHSLENAELFFFPFDYFCISKNEKTIKSKG